MAHLIPRQQVLRLYKEILSAGRRWEAAVAADTGREREYIRAEARRLFRKNQNVNGVKYKRVTEFIYCT